MPPLRVARAARRLVVCDSCLRRAAARGRVGAFMAAPLLLDLSHTCHTRARTGIQRVSRALADALGAQAAPITFDPYFGGWRLLEAWESANLAATEPANRRGGRWPWTKQVRGHARRLLSRSRSALPPNAGRALIVPEIFSSTVARNFASLTKVITGPRVAVFHDGIPLKLPEFTPPKTVARFPAYLQELLTFDGIAAVSEDSRDTLVDYWRWLGVSATPPVQVVPLGIEPVRAASPRPSSSATPNVLCVGSIEGRKNHLALFEACEALWARGRHFTLHVVGLARPETAGTALVRLRDLQAAGRPLVHHGAVSDQALADAYAACAFSVYPSLMEGFGLPVLESLSHGKPCVCLNRGALAESARGGGCLTVDAVDAASLAQAIDTLLSDAACLARLSAEARARTFRTWRNYADDLVAWMRTLRQGSEGVRE